MADALLGAAVVLFDLMLSADMAPESVTGSMLVGLFGSVAAAVVVLAWRRRRPLAVLALMVAHLAGTAIVVPELYRPELGVLLALYTVASASDTRSALTALIGTYTITTAIIAVVELAKPAVPGETSVLLTVVVAQLFLVVAAWGVGRWSRASRQNLRMVEELAHLRRREGIRTERDTIARELHDIVAHAVTVMVVQSGAAKRVLSTDPVWAREALEHVADAGAEAMTELRTMLGALRAEESVDTGDVQTDVSLDRDLLAVLDRVRATGVDVVEHQRGTRGPLDRSTELMAVRVVQESLTNVTRHAGPGSTATVTLLWEEDRLRITVVDDGAGRRDDHVAALSSGLGLVGLSERVAVVGGQVGWGARDGGFEVRAAVPLRARAGEVAGGLTSPTLDAP